MNTIRNANKSEGIMTALVRPIRAYPLIIFFILACLFGWVVYIAWALGADVTPDGNPLGPLVAAAIVAASLGQAGLKDWGHFPDGAGRRPCPAQLVDDRRVYPGGGSCVSG
jgi:hypothetical protein